MKAIVLLRTAVVVLLLGLMLLASLGMCAHWKLPQEFFMAAKDGLVAMAGIAVAKSMTEHLANGRGVIGGLKILLTDAKPDQPAGGTP